MYKIYEKYLQTQIENGETPKHVGLILNGNRRWAENHSYPKHIGHRVGAEVAEKLLEWCRDLKIKTLTLYVLSTENLERDKEELNELYKIIEEKLQKLMNDERIHKYKIRVKTLGKKELLPERIRRILDKVEKDTENYSDYFLNIAIAYGGRLEILEVVRKIAEKVKKGEIEPSQITQKIIEENLYTAHLPNPEPDLVIRTSGEERLSGFLLWQSAYSELVFLDVYWPDFRKIDLMRAIRTYQKRVRRFGK
ncbi:MAG: polyprenyl diphosphate synthase [Nitrososphaerota archaeon]|nr:polyprenyl diphosphate synthase [Nitrososphaerales archaeon]MDW8044966.1 polyprenyl diphosphate synthase [Nitrososphaerota archaeon]